jgi:Flp pilus assembly protein TadD
MRRILLSITLVAAISAAGYAQKKAVKDAKAALTSKNYSEARDQIKGALSNPETANDPETWKTAGDIENAAFDGERIKQQLKQTFDEKAMYDAVYSSIEPYAKADELGQKPDEKGKVKNKYRKDIASILKSNLPFLINGGVFYNDKKDFKRAADFFEAYIEVPSLPVFEGATPAQLGANDTLRQTIKYYAAITAIQSGDRARSIKLLKSIVDNPYTPNTSSKESDAYELLTNQYLEAGDSTNYVKSLEDGAKRFPASKYFTPNLINYLISKGKSQAAVTYLDQAIANDPTNACQLLSVKASIFGEKNDFANADANYKSALEKDPNCERALEGLAVSYIVQAQNLKEVTSRAATRKEQSAKDPQIIKLYSDAYPLLEKYRTLLAARGADKSDIKGALVKLQNAYYNLSLLGVNKDKEVSAIEKELAQ